MAAHSLHRHIALVGHVLITRDEDVFTAGPLQSSQLLFGMSRSMLNRRSYRRSHSTFDVDSLRKGYWPHAT